MPSRFEKEREGFQKLKKRLESDATLSHELEGALRALLSEYNTTVHENRFLAGGVCERILGATMRASGIKAKNVGVFNPRIDIEIEGGEGYSVKGSFTGKRDDIRLINSLGESSTRKWSEATLFVLSNQGISYADPDLLKGATESFGDALVLKRSKLDQFFKRNPEWTIQCEVAPKSADLTKTKVASVAVAREIVGRGQSPNLLKHLD